MEEMLLKDLSSLDWLSILNKALLEPSKLPAILAEYSILPEQLLKLGQKSKKNSEPYGRQILYKSPEIEVMLAQWSFKSAASPHNHGFSKGLIWFVKGDFNEQQFEFKQGGLSEVGAPAFFNEGQVATVVSSDIHSCCPVTEGISLHIYSPAIRNMKVWDVENKETLTVADECGAWVPQNTDMIIKRVKWA
jgi:cysteine dioxygenase